MSNLDDQIRTLMASIGEEISDLDKQKVELERIHAGLSSILAGRSSNAFEQRTGLTLTPTATASAFVEKPTIPLRDAIQTILASRHKTGMNYIELRKALIAQGYDMQNTNVLSGTLVGLTKHGHITRDRLGSYVFVKR